jgi:hypothetical protein
MIVDKVRPTDEMIEKAWDVNPDGGGIAYREGEGANKVVVWKKGLDLEELRELIKNTPMPYIAHFRRESQGGKLAKLTHPFPVDHNASLALTGKTKGHVLFHNGNWVGWQYKCETAAINSGIPLPAGKWSDTRALAWLCSVIGHGYFEFQEDQKGVIFGPNDYDIFTGKDGWKKVNDTVWCSNDRFMTKSSPVVVHNADHSNHGTAWMTKYCKFGNCTREDIDYARYCPLHKDGVDQRFVNKGTGGSQENSPSPFPKLSEGQIISLELAEKLFETKTKSGKRLISRKLIRKIRGLHAQAEFTTTQEGKKARKKLEDLSLSLTSGGRVH